MENISAHNLIILQTEPKSYIQTQHSYLSPENSKDFTYENKTSFDKINLSEMHSMDMFEYFTSEKSERTRTRTSKIKKSKRSLARSHSTRDCKEKRKSIQNKLNAINAINQIKIPNSTHFINEDEESSESEAEESFNLNDQIDKRMRVMKDNMIDKLDKYKKIIEKNYDNHIKKIKSNLMQKAKRISQVINNNMRRNLENRNLNSSPLNNSENFVQHSKTFGNFYSNKKESESPKKEIEYMRKYTQKNLDEKMNQIFDLHSKIESSIEKNFEILNSFLNNYDLSQKYPMEDFVNENADAILDSWIFSKINFEKLNMINFIENDKIPNSLKKFIYQDTNNKFSMISIKKSKNYEFDKNLMHDNYSILEKLCFKNLDHEEFKKVFTQISQIDGLKFNKLKEILIEDCILESSNFNNLFPNTERILISNSLIKLNFTNVSKDFSKLKILSIKNSNLNNKNFSSLIEDFSNSKEILENLEIIDLADNKLTTIDLQTMSDFNKKFYSLQIFILNKNKIQKFKPQNLNCLPNLKFLNLSSNNFTCSKDFIEMREKTKKSNQKILILVGNNFFALNSKRENSQYIKYLTETLREFDFFLRKLDFSKTFNNFNKNSLLEINLNTNIQISLKKLKLSFCSLDSNTLFNFIKNNSGFINLRTLDVSDNLIDDNFFKMYDNVNLSNLMENLEVIKIRNNKISAKCFDHLKNIIHKQKKLKKIFLSQNLIENNFVDMIQSNPGIKKINSFENLRTVNNKLESNFEDSSYKEIVSEEIKSNTGSYSHTEKDSNMFNFFDSLFNLKKEELKIYFSKRAEHLINKYFNQTNESGLNKLNTLMSFSYNSSSFNSNSGDNFQDINLKKNMIVKKFIKFDS